MMKKTCLAMLLLFACVMGRAQSFNQEQTALKNFLVRMYKAEPFEGVQVVQDYEHYYLVSAVVLARNENVPVQSLNRAAQVKSQRQVAQYMGAYTKTSSQTIIKMRDDIKTGATVADVVDVINEMSVGNTLALQTLGTIEDAENGNIVYIFYRRLDEMQNNNKKHKNKKR